MDRPDGLEFSCTSKHRSWLNIAGNELSCMTRQCIRPCRIGDLEMLLREIQAWSSNVRGRQRGADWHIAVDDARRKLKPVHPRMLL